MPRIKEETFVPDIVRAAADFASAAHTGQTRTGTARPYLEHPAATAAILTVPSAVDICRSQMPTGTGHTVFPVL